MLQITFIMTLRMIFCCFNPLIYNFAQFGLFSISGNHLLRYSEIELTIPNFFLDFNTAAESIQTAPKRRGAKPCDTRTVRFSTTLPVLRDYWRVHPVRSSLNYASLSPDIWQFAMLPGRLSFVRWATNHNWLWHFRTDHDQWILLLLKLIEKTGMEETNGNADFFLLGLVTPLTSNNHDLPWQFSDL